MNSPFEIKSINMFSSWIYNLPKNHDCTICRCNLNIPSLYNQEKGIESYIVTGTCQHSFHYECIKPWVDKNKHCPLCAQPWQYLQPPVQDQTDNDKIDTPSKKISIKKKINISKDINKNYIDKNYIDKKYTMKDYWNNVKPS